MELIKCHKCNKEFNSKDALNMHNKSKHFELYKEPFMTDKQKKNIRNYVIIAIFLLAIAGLYYWRITPPKNAPIMVIEPGSYDFGNVKQSEGEVSATILVSNKGNMDLLLKDMETSCGCTSAAMINGGVEGPRFGMKSHGTNPKNWRQAIKPGENAQLKVYYNPNVHKDLRGIVKRSVSIYSNDPRNKVKEVMISANQVD